MSLREMSPTNSFFPISALTQMIVVEMILCLRVYGIYGKKKVLYCLGILLTVCVVSCVIIVASVGAGHKAIDSSKYL